MNLVALDLSTKPGFAIYLNSELHAYGTLWADRKVEDFGLYPFNYPALAKHVAARVVKEVLQPALRLSQGQLTVVIEETTSSQNNYSQKKLEFIHFAVLEALKDQKIYYVRDGQWKKVVEAKLNQEEKDRNKAIKKYKEDHGTKLAKLDLDGSGKLRVAGKITTQHVYLRRLKELFGITLDAKCEDQAAAILLGKAFLMGVNLCDGGTTGGVGKKKKAKGKKK